MLLLKQVGDVDGRLCSLHVIVMRASRYNVLRGEFAESGRRVLLLLIVLRDCNLKNWCECECERERVGFERVRKRMLSLGAVVVVVMMRDE